jgi:hypothetical protein
MRYLLLRHQVRDYDRWRPMYDAHSIAREAVGLEQLHLFRDAGDPNVVTILYRTEDLDAARMFAESPELLELMKQAGVMDKPEMCVMNEA